MSAVFDAATLANRATSALRAYDPSLDLPTLRARFGDALSDLSANENPPAPIPHALPLATRHRRDPVPLTEPAGAYL